MEVIRDVLPKNNFLKKLRKLSNEKKIILIFDECTSGFRECFGGIHKKCSINPDMLMLGKALGNGYTITAVLGNQKTISSINKTFISSTFWTDSSGPTAAMKTLEIMEAGDTSGIPFLAASRLESSSVPMLCFPCIHILFSDLNPFLAKYRCLVYESSSIFL